jgi:beta-glucoside PTS system EIICBA component
MNKYDGLARIILQNVGGKANIVSVTHCITRLRFKLRDENLAKTDILKRTDGVVNVLKAGGLYQVVIGQQVPDVYDALIETGHLENLAEAPVSSAGEKKSVMSAFISLVTGVFVPILGMLCATGIIKGVLMALSFFHLIDPASGTYIILYNGADALFYFLPVLIGYTAAKKFGMNEITGIMLGLVMCVPAIVGLAPNAIAVAFGKAPAPLGTFLGMNYYTKLFGIPVIMPASGNYTSSVIPIILVIWSASSLEKWIKKIMPASIKSFGVPLVVFLITVPLMFIIIGPVAAIITDFIGKGATFIFSKAAIIGGLFVGGFWQILVIFGLHWGLVPLMFINIANLKYDMVLSPYFAASFAQLAALIAVMIKTKDKQTKSIGIPAIISAIAGVTEPSIYGVTLPRRKPFIFSCVGAAIGGAIISASKSYLYISGGLGIFGIPGFIMTQEYADMYHVPLSMHGVTWSCIAVLVAMAVTFTLVMLFYKEPETGSLSGSGSTAKTVSEDGTSASVTVTSPITGKVMNLSEVPDEAFSSGTLGKGCAVLPSVGEVRSPCDGIISVLPSTSHAVGITSNSGADILIHVGMNTVELNGKGFTVSVKEGQKVKKGDLIIAFDMDTITKAGYSIITPVIVSNTDRFPNVSVHKEPGTLVDFGEDLFSAAGN